MQKWIRDRMRRRKKKTAEASPAAEANPPLQPIYPDVDSDSTTGGDSTVETEPVAAAESGESEAQSPEAERSRSRRRRKKRPAKPVAESAIAGAPPEVQQSRDENAGAVLESPAHSESALPEAAEPAPTAPTTAAQKGRRPSKGAVVLAVGLPGSGKSTWFKRHNVVPLSSDMVRHLLFDDSSEQRYQDLVFGTLRSLLRARLIAKMPMNYVDATNLSPKERRHWIRMAKDFGYDAHAVYFDVPMEVCMDRNRRRNRIVPEDVMHRMAAKLRPPTFDEGFAKIIVVRVKPRTGAEASAEDAEQSAD